MAELEPARGRPPEGHDACCEPSDGAAIIPAGKPLA